MPGTARSHSSLSTWAELTLRRRDLLRGSALAIGALALPLARPARAAFELPSATRLELDQAQFVYISPLHADGRESTCHGEVWYAYDDGDVLVATSKDAWKAKAVRIGLDTARLWVGDLGRGKSALPKLASAPSFKAGARRDRDPEAWKRLLASFAQRYPAEWDKWEPRFKKGYDEGSRVLIRYQPIDG